MDAITMLERAGGAARLKDLTGVSRRSLRQAVQRREILRPARAVYALPSCERPHLVAVGVDGALSCASAAAAHGLDLLRPPSVVHVRCPRGSRQTWPKVVVHRRGAPAERRVTDLLTTVLDCAGCLPFPEAVAVCDAALRRGRVSQPDLEAAVAHLRADDVRRQMMTSADARSDSILESVIRVELRLRGLQVDVQVRYEGIGHVDLVVEGWLVIELDGYAHHADRDSFRIDRRRDVEHVRAGREILRFTFDDVLHRREWLIEAVFEVLTHGGRVRVVQPGTSPVEATP